MERTDTGIGSLHFVSCLNKQARITGHYVFYAAIPPILYR